MIVMSAIILALAAFACATACVSPIWRSSNIADPIERIRVRADWLALLCSAVVLTAVSTTLMVGAS